MSCASEQELRLIQQIVERIEDLNLSSEYLQPKNLVRFLRARNENLDQVEQMIRKNVSWLEEYDVENAMIYSAPPNFQENFPWSIVGFDNCDGPLVVLPMGRWSPTAVSGMRDHFIKLSIQYFETVWRTMRLRSKGKDYIPQFTIILDMEGLGWKHYTTYDCLQGILTMLKFFEANYPETIRLGVFVNAPSIFSLFWKLIKPMMSESTQGKLLFLGSDKEAWRSALEKYASLDSFPAFYGGNLPDSHHIGLDDLKSNNLKYIGQNGNECAYGL